MKDELRIHVTRPRLKINWESPRHLLLSGGFNSLKKDYAPIGHFTVEIKSSLPHRYGIQHVITGMERENKEESTKVVWKKKLGLGSMTYAFKGALTTFEKSYHDLLASEAEGRLKTLVVPTTPEISSRLFDFLDRWIQHGSYTIYGGHKDALRGEGAGCADFAMACFELATGYQLEDWCINLSIPKKFIGDDNHQVSLAHLFLASHWEDSGEKLKLKTADTDLAFEWIKQRAGANQEFIYRDHLNRTFQMEIPDFTYRYPTQKSEEEIWKTICPTT